MTGARTSVVVCTHRRPDQLERCLRSLAALDPAPLEVIVVNSTPQDDLTKALAARFGARYLVDWTNGASRRRNTGGIAALGDLVAYIDDDATADASWLSDHEAAFGDPRVAATTGRILPLATTDVPPPSDHEGDFGTEAWQIDRSSAMWFERTNFGGAGMGPNMVFRRSLFDAGFGFPERIGPGTPVPGGEENYAFFDVVRRGHVLAYVPTAIVRHGIQAPSAPAVRDRRRRILRASAAYMIMLALEERGFRGRALRYAATSRVGRARAWRTTPGLPVDRTARTDLLIAAVLAPVLYLRSRMGR